MRARARVAASAPRYTMFYHVIRAMPMQRRARARARRAATARSTRRARKRTRAMMHAATLRAMRDTAERALRWRARHLFMRAGLCARAKRDARHTRHATHGRRPPQYARRRVRYAPPAPGVIYAITLLVVTLTLLRYAVKARAPPARARHIWRIRRRASAAPRRAIMRRHHALCCRRYMSRHVVICCCRARGGVYARLPRTQRFCRARAPICYARCAALRVSPYAHAIYDAAAL